MRSIRLPFKFRKWNKGTGSVETGTTGSETKDADIAETGAKTVVEGATLDEIDAKAQGMSKCSTENAIIENDDLISTFQVDCVQKQYNYCEFDGRMNMDYDPSIQPYHDRCYELDGQIFLFNWYLECTDDFTGILDQAYWIDYPMCLGKSCTGNDLTSLLENEWKPEFPAKCYVSYETRPSSPLSGTCATDSIDLQNDTDALFPNWTLPESSGWTYNFENTTQKYEAACLKLGGTVYNIEEVSIQCNTSLNGVHRPYKASLLNDVYCFGTTCTRTDVQEYIHKYWDPINAISIEESDTRYSACIITSTPLNQGVDKSPSSSWLQSPWMYVLFSFTGILGVSMMLYGIVLGCRTNTRSIF